MDWYPRYYSLWKAKTMHLDPFQDGCYLRLVDHYMETRQPLPDNDAALARIVGISLEQWLGNASGILRAFFFSKNGLLFHDRCDQILREQDERSKKQTEKSIKGAQARWNKNNELDATGIPQAMPNDATGQDKTRQDMKEEPPLPPLGFSKFWDLYPKQRIGSRDKAEVAYLKALTRTTEEKIHGAVIEYAGSDEVARGFAKGCAAWLKDDSWNDDYSTPNRTPQGKRAYADSIKAAGEFATSALEEKARIRRENGSD